jgi:hypothetical protein
MSRAFCISNWDIVIRLDICSFDNYLQIIYLQFSCISEIYEKPKANDSSLYIKYLLP